ncbi:MAG: hypothetical protein AAFQ98_03585 [Bacteroidota bacterium]
MKRYGYLGQLLVFLILVPIGFRRYFFSGSQVFSLPLGVHLHAMGMVLWCLVLLAQWKFARRGPFSNHRRLGIAAATLAPLLVASMLWMLGYSFERMAPHLSLEDNLAQVFYPFSQTLGFSLFFLLAWLNRRQGPHHKVYILWATVILLGPTLGRLPWSQVGLQHIDMDLWIMNGIVLLFTLATGRRKHWKPYAVGMLVFAGLHLGYLFLPYTDVWQIIAKGWFLRKGAPEYPWASAYL